MELASAVNKAAMEVRRTRMRAFAEGEVQRDINGAQNDGREGVVIKVPVEVNMRMLTDYIVSFGYDVTDVGHSDRNLKISWNDPKK